MAGAFAIAFALVVSGAVASAQQPKKVPRIGYLAAGDPLVSPPVPREFGWLCASLATSKDRTSPSSTDMRRGSAIGPLSLPPSWCVSRLILSWYQEGTCWIRAAKNATKTIPIVMAGGGIDPVKAGLVESLARPGGNVTGITNLGRELGGKRLELLKEAVPKLARVAVLYDPAAPGTAREVKEGLPVAARALRLTVQPWEVRGADDFERVFAAMDKQRPDGLYVPRAR